MDVSSLTRIFFEALDYPELTRLGFLIKKQQESGWDKGLFLNALVSLYHDYELIFSIHYSSQRKSHPGLTKEETTIPLKEFIDDTSGKTVSFKQVKAIYLTILAAFEIGKPEKTYTSEETLSLVEYALWFIHKEFKIQTKDIIEFKPRPRTPTYFVYEVVQDGPFFNFPHFKKTIRGLLLSGQSPAALKHIFQKFYDAATEIVSIWNHTLSMLERTAATSDEKLPPEIVKVEFYAQRLSHAWWNDVPEFSVKKYELFLNQDFASYAAQIANLLASEVLNYPEVRLNPGKNFIADFCNGIRHLLYIEKNAACIRELLDGKKNESAFRYWFATWFEAKDYIVDTESEKGSGRIDLKVRESETLSRIIEFKGWWNRDKVLIIRQICSYLTAFDGEGYILLINDTPADITSKYKEIITDSETGYIKGSWEKVQFADTAFSYFSSKHTAGAQVKSVYHFILSPIG